MVSFLFPELIGEVAGEIDFFRIIEGHLADKWEDHIGAKAHFQGVQFIVITGKFKIEACFHVEARAEGGMEDAGKHSSTAEDVVQIMDFGIIADDFGESGIVVEHLHIIRDSDSEGCSGGNIVAHLHAAPIRLLVQRALVTVTTTKEKQRIELAVAERTHALIIDIHRTDGFRMLVIEELHLPIMFVVKVRGASVLEAHPQPAGVGEDLDIPFLSGHIMIKLPHILRRRQQSRHHTS